MHILINGQREISPPCTIAELVARKGLSPQALVVELNRTLIRQELWPTIRLKDDDILELLSFVGGG